MSDAITGDSKNVGVSMRSSEFELKQEETVKQN